MKKFRFALICMLIFFPVLLVAQDEDDTPLNVDSSIVVVNATVSDKKGKQVTGLKKSQFKLFVDGKEREITSFAAEETPFAVVILLDTSGSMEQRVTLARAAAIQFLGGLRVDDVVAVYNFDSKISKVQDFSNSRDIYPSVYELKADGMTLLNDAVYKASELLAKRTEKRKAIVVLSDGIDTISKFSADKALKAALAADAVVYTVDMFPDAKQGQLSETQKLEKVKSQGVLKKFAEKSGGTYVSSPGGEALREAFKNIVAELGRQVTFVFEPGEKMLDGKWHKIEVKTENPDLFVRTREGFNTQKPK
jgi:Ca-activated chloride channel family protein